MMKKFIPLEEREPSLARLLFYHSSEEVRYASSVDNFIHVTDLWDLCPREYFLLRKYSLKKERVVAPNTRLLFEMGKAMEKVIVGWLREINIIGTEQYSLANKKLGVVGNCDIQLGNERLVEIKAKDPAIFRMTKRKPLSRDEFQCKTYLALAEKKEMTLLYVTWGQERMPFRDHKVTYDVRVPEMIKKLVTPIREAEAEGKYPPRVCGSKQDTRARLCPVADYCFNYPGEKIKTIKEQMEN